MTSSTQFPLTLAAAKRAEKGQWAIGDALIEEVGPPSRGARQDEAFKECAKELAGRGMPYSSGYLRELRNVAHSFNVDDRPSTLGVETARMARTPEVLAEAEELAKAEGVPVTKRFVGKVRKARLKQERRKKGIKEPPKRDPSRVPPKKDPTKTQVGREIRIMEIEGAVRDVGKIARDVTAKLAGFDLEDWEREALVADIDTLLATWTAIREVVVNPIGDEAEAYLRSV